MKTLSKKSLRILWIVFVVVFFFSGCKQKKKVIPEEWISKPKNQWPAFALTNEVSFNDTTFTDLANAFLIDTGTDTFGVSCKHIFMLFRNELGIQNLQLPGHFNYWNLYPENQQDKLVEVKRIMNENPNEKVTEFRLMKNIDWIIFELKQKPKDLYPLKIRYTPVRPNEIVYAIGWGDLQKNKQYPAIQKYQCIQAAGNHYFMKNLDTKYHPNGRSGSVVLDKNGYVVGLISGSEASLTVICGVSYLKQQFNKYNISFVEN